MNSRPGQPGRFRGERGGGFEHLLGIGQQRQTFGRQPDLAGGASKSLTPAARSSLVMAWLMAGWDMPWSAAAVEKLSRAATLAKHWISLSISITNA